MKGFKSRDIKKVLMPGVMVGHADDMVVDRFLIDSRSLTEPGRSMFFAIATENNDGHRFVDELIEKGVGNVVVTDDIESHEGVNVYKVNDAVESLQTLASFHRGRFSPSMKVVAVTGSRGKTRVKEWMSSLLPGMTCRSMRSFNSQTGVALSLLDVDTEADYAIIEAGISQVDEMKRLEGMIRPCMTIITNVTDEHADGFESRKRQIDEKIIMAQNAAEVVFHKTDRDGGLSATIMESVNAERLYCWGNDETDGSLFLTETGRSIDAKKGETVLSYRCEGKDYRCVVRLTDSNDIDNALTTLTALHRLVKEFIPPATLPFENITTRIDVMGGLNGAIILHDRFTNDSLSLRGALDFARRRIPHGRRMSVLVADTILSKDFDRHQLEALCGEYGVDEVIVVNNSKDFVNLYSADNFVDRVVLVKGSPGDRMDRIVSMLEQKQHETRLEINLDNLVHNFNFFKGKVDRSTAVVVMLKANGYGCGSLELAKTLQPQGAAAIAVAVIDEGIELRKAGITMPVIVLNPRADNYKLMFDYRLEPEVYSFDILDRIIAKAERSGVKDFPIHLKLDTGMHRLGFGADDLPTVCERLRSIDSVRVSSVFSHLATADCLDMDDYTCSQLDLFDRCIIYLRNNLENDFKAHILNTAGILRFADRQHEMVRLGIGLYGLPVVNDGSEYGLRPVAALYTTVIALATRHDGDTIGYSRRGYVSGDRIIATLPIGYADGLDRRLGNGNAAFKVNGVDCPTVGNICMDLCMIDVTDAGARVGDRVEIFGPEADICRLARSLGTIPYEILTSISERVKRIYYRE